MADHDEHDWSDDSEAEPDDSDDEDEDYYQMVLDGGEVVNLRLRDMGVDGARQVARALREPTVVVRRLYL